MSRPALTNTSCHTRTDSAVAPQHPHLMHHRTTSHDRRHL